MPGLLLSDAELKAQESKELYEVVELPGRGRGVLAAASIKKGTRIWSEKPLIAITEEPSKDYVKANEQMASLLEGLPLETQNEILAFHNAHVGTLPELSGIMQTNGFTLDDGRVALFSKACMLNHSCRPTIEAEFNLNTGEMNIVAVRDLAPGDELLNDYLHTLDTYEVRQLELKFVYGFECDCVVCSLPEKERAVSDKLRMEYHACEDMIVKSIFAEPEACLYAVKHMLDVIEKDQIVGAHAGKTYYYACQTAIARGDIARARVFGERAYRGIATFKGVEHPDSASILRAIKNPEKHQLYGDSFVWRTTVYDKPQGMNAEELEKWLWEHAGGVLLEEAEHDGES